jgi:hypothetical protein
MYNTDFTVKYHFRGTNKGVCNVVNEILKSDITGYHIVMDQFMDGVGRSMWFLTDSEEDMENVKIIRMDVSKKKKYKVYSGKTA